MHIDLHTHTTASDGMLEPMQLVQKARECGVRVLSITDHDTMAAYEDLVDRDTGLRLIPGIEWSTRWQKLEIHIVGLNVRPENADLRDGIRQQQHSRMDRADRIAAKLEKLGVDTPLAGAERLAQNRHIGRPHFARHMVDCGFVRNESQAFDKYLSAGKAAYCRTEWAPMEQVIEWTHSAGGLAVLAHPAAYKLTRSKLTSLIAGFKAAGGDAMEVVSGRQTRDMTSTLANLCRKQGLLASCGSDYHRSAPGFAEPGGFETLPSACRPVWESGFGDRGSGLVR
ncbi:MAG: PHP domain-containing protein [Gammaproteobacteria bacterium]